MLRFPLPLFTALAVVLSAPTQSALAQSVKSAGAVPAKSHAKRAAVSDAKNQVSPELAVLPDLSPEQLAIANRVALGKMPCEFSAHVVVKPDVRGAGRFVLELGKQRFSMVPVPTLTGTSRLEDQVAGVTWLQLSNKSMLMSQKQGKRLADACASADQLIVAKELERNPAPSLLDTPVRLQAVAQDNLGAVPEVAIAVDRAPQ
jgi:hypothetical protein